MTIYAEDINYFNTSKTAPDTWIDKAKKEITSIGGRVMQSGYADLEGKSAFLLTFQIGTDTFQIRWETLPARNKGTNDLMRRRQAATLLYHDVKHKVVMAKIRGVRSTFLEYLMMPNGQTAGEASKNVEQWQVITANMPIMLGSGKVTS